MSTHSSEPPSESFISDMWSAASSHTPVQSCLSNLSILSSLHAGDIIISPFSLCNLSTSSYDVTLGPWYYRESVGAHGVCVFNPYSSSDVCRVWGTPQRAERVSEWCVRTGQTQGLENIPMEEHIIFLKPGETVLAHTNEFIGGKNNITTMMKARSSLGRNFIEVCKCAGWGDVGYVNRWTMEITNNSQHYSIPLVVGRRIAQIVFFGTDRTFLHSSYSHTGKYQTHNDMAELIKNWKPQDMIPKMSQDKEIHLGPQVDILETIQGFTEEENKERIKKKLKDYKFYVKVPGAQFDYMD